MTFNGDYLFQANFIQSFLTKKMKSQIKNCIYMNHPFIGTNLCVIWLRH